MSDQPTTPEPTQETTTPETESRGVQDRINQLTRQRHDAARRADEAEAQVSAMAAKIDELTSKLDTISPSKPDPLAQLLGQEPKASPAQPAQSGPNIDSIVQAAVQKALNPIIESQVQAQEAAQLRAEQTRSFQEAASDLPEIATAGSKAQEIFDQIWSANPQLQQSPNGPAIVIQAVKGVLSSTPPAETEAKKVAATSPQPGAPTQRLADLPDPSKKEAEVLDAIKTKMNQGEPLDQAEMDAYYGLALGTLNLRE